MPLTPQQRVEKVLRGGHADKVPFTMYECMIPQCAAERQMRNRGLCIVNRRGVFRTHRPGVKVTQQVYWQDGRQFTRTFYDTPQGQLTSLSESAGFTNWSHEKLFKGPQDYKAILFLIRDEQYEPTYADFVEAQERLGEDAICRAGIALEPLQQLISGEFLDMQTFCLEWMDRRDELLKLYAALVENRRRMYKLVAESPAGHANYGGNVVPEIIGLENFRRYYLPHYHEAAEVLHKHGKLIGSHLDANCKLLAEAINQTQLDYVEAFTPAPDTDMSMAQARAAWPGKVLWLNFPSSLHLAGDEQVRQAAHDLIEQAGGPDGVIVGITEDMPPHRWRDSCQAIMDGLDRHAAARPGQYR